MVSLRHLFASRLSVKLIGSSLVLVILMVSLSVYSVDRGRNAIIEAVGSDTLFLAQTMSSAVDRTLYLKHHELWFTGSSELAQEELASSNAAFDAMEDPEGYIESVDEEWLSTPMTETTPTMDAILQNNLSRELWYMLDDHYVQEHGVDIYFGVFVTNKYGAVAAMSVRTGGYAQDGTDCWQDCLANGSYFGPVEYEEHLGQYGLYISTKLLDSEDRFVGTITGFINIVAVVEEAGFLMVKYETTEISILTKEGRQIYSTSTYHMLQDISQKDYYQKATESSGYFIADEGGRSRLFSYTYSTGYLSFDGHGWMVLVSHDVSEVLASVSDLTYSMIVVSAAVIGLAIVSSYGLSVRISRPVKELAENSRQFSKGDLSLRVDVRRSDEIGQLAESFNSMADELQSLYSDLEGKVKERTAELEQVTKKLRLLGSITRHDAINQITVLRGFLSMIEESIDDPDTLSRLKKVEEAGENIRSYLEFTGDYEKVGVHGPEWMDIGAQLPAQLFGLNLGSVELRNGLKGLELYADPMLPKVFRNLLDNSVKHGGRVSKVSITWREAPDELQILYEDDGAGIAAEAKDKLFERSTKAGRRSYGLYLSREILAITGMSIRETGEPGKGARFEISVPKGKYRVPGSVRSGTP